MSDTTLNLTFDKMRIRVAEYLGIADYSGSAAALPTDPIDLEKVSRIVNDGYRRFILENEKWNFLSVPLSLTFQQNLVGGDPAHYFLPDDFYGILLMPFTYLAGGPRITIIPVEEARIRELNAGASVTGNPSMVCFRPINVTATATGGRWEAIFWPIPSGTQSVVAVYKRFPQALVNGTDTSVAGFQHDESVLAAAIAAAELQVGDQAGPREAFYQSALKRSLKVDARSAPAHKQDYGDKSEDRGQFGRRPLNYYGVSTYNGVVLNP